MPDIPELRSYAIEQPLEAGNTLRCFSSGNRIRVARILTAEGQLVGYGEAQSLDVALSDAAENYYTGESYGRQYRDENARYPHRVEGTREPVSEVDHHLLRGGKLLARWTGGQLVAELHDLKDLPESEVVGEAIRINGLPTTVTQYGRVFFVEGTYEAQSIHTLSLPHESSDTYAAVARIGLGATLREAIAAALTADEVEVPEGQSAY